MLLHRDFLPKAAMIHGKLQLGKLSATDSATPNYLVLGAPLVRCITSTSDNKSKTDAMSKSDRRIRCRRALSHR
jgi:hypothetical protein